MEVITDEMVLTFIAKASAHGPFITIIDLVDFVAKYVEAYSIGKLSAAGFKMTGTDKLCMASEFVDKSISELLRLKLISDSIAHDLTNAAYFKQLASSVVYIWNQFRQTSLHARLKAWFAKLTCCKCCKPATPAAPVVTVVAQ